MALVGQGTSAFGRLRRLSTVLRWSDADRCMLVGSLMLAAVIVFWAATSWLGGWPYFASSADPELVAEVASVGLFAVVVWTAQVGLCLAARRRARQSRALVGLTVVMYAITTALFAYQTGPFNSVGWIAFLGGTMVGFLLFEHRMMLVGIATWLASLAGVAYLNEIGALPFAPMVRPTFGSGELSSAWLIRMGVASTVLAAVVLWLSAFIIKTWREREALLEQLSKTDSLTGAINRRHFMELLEHELRQARRYERPLAVVMIDLDHFKRVNDEHGHLAGDAVLLAAAGAITRSLRDSDVVGRYGGEEFALILPNTDLAGAREVAERCRASVASSRAPTGGGTVGVTASMGIASYPAADIDTVDDLLRAADQALYRAKAAGRDRVEASVATSR